ncbi:MAG: hypothetical protein ACI97B_003879 [Verrucomicrobiales bacterium]|jgi:hypothetical protein
MKASVRVNAGNLNHHLWNNHGDWWCHYTVHLPDYSVERIRLSLKTADLAEARARRDRLFAGLMKEAA